MPASLPPPNPCRRIVTKAPLGSRGWSQRCSLRKRKGKHHGPVTVDPDHLPAVRRGRILRLSLGILWRRALRRRADLGAGHRHSAPAVRRRRALPLLSEHRGVGRTLGSEHAVPLNATQRCTRNQPCIPTVLHGIGIPSAAAARRTLSLRLPVIDYLSLTTCHCEERSDEAISHPGTQDGAVATTREAGRSSQGKS